MVDTIDLTKLGEQDIKLLDAPVQPAAIATANPSPVYRHRDLPWGDISTSIRGIDHIEDALNTSGLNWKVVQEPVFRKNGALIKNRLANIREDTDDFIEIVSNRYHPFQNSQAYAFIEGILGTGAMKLETAGHFGYDSVFIEARTEGIHVLGDTIMPYILIKNSHDGSSGVKVCMTPTRVICENTLSLALKTAQRVWQVRHTRSVEDRMQEAQETLGLIEHYTEEFPVVAEEMAAKNVGEKEIVSVLEKMFPVGKNDGERAVNNIKDAVREIMSIYTQTPDLKRFHGTAWGFYNAVGDYTTHHVPIKEVRGWRETRLNKIIEGHPLLDTAQEALAAIPA